MSTRKVPGVQIDAQTVDEHHGQRSVLGAGSLDVDLGAVTRREGVITSDADYVARGSALSAAYGRRFESADQN